MFPVLEKLHCVRSNSMSFLANYLPQKAVINITWWRKIKAISVDQLTIVRVKSPTDNTLHQAKKIYDWTTFSLFYLTSSGVRMNWWYDIRFKMWSAACCNWPVNDKLLKRSSFAMTIQTFSVLHEIRSICESGAVEESLKGNELECGRKVTSCHEISVTKSRMPRKFVTKMLSLMMTVILRRQIMNELSSNSISIQYRKLSLSKPLILERLSSF